MPSFDVVSKVDNHELTNAVDQANRELQNRFDFKGVEAEFKLVESNVELTAPSDFQVKQMQEILQKKVTSREIDVTALKFQDIESNLSQAKQVVNVQNGLDTKTAKDIIKLIKKEKLKVQTSIQGDQVRVTGKKRDDLQTAMSFLREQPLGLPLQFENFRD